MEVLALVLSLVLFRFLLGSLRGTDRIRIRFHSAPFWERHPIVVLALVVVGLLAWGVWWLASWIGGLW